VPHNTQYDHLNKGIPRDKKTDCLWGEIQILLVLYYFIFTYVTTPMQFNNAFEYVPTKHYIGEIILIIL